MTDEPQPLVLTTHAEIERDGAPVTDPAWFPERSVRDAVTGKVTKILPEPNYNVSEASKFFFAQKPDWLRWRSKKPAGTPEEIFYLSGVELPDHRTDANFRYYTLADIEAMAEALADNGGISGSTLRHIKTLIHTLCIMYGYIEDTPHDEVVEQIVLGPVED